ncbi:MAG: hypothetical protein HZA34_04530 [Candidatus Pacebacteria bacterium]|nr:hypothetical protein [Candidatus Paceibacterota bacterium]
MKIEILNKETPILFRLLTKGKQGGHWVWATNGFWEGTIAPNELHVFRIADDPEDFTNIGSFAILVTAQQTLLVNNMPIEGPCLLFPPHAPLVRISK